MKVSKILFVVLLNACTSIIIQSCTQSANANSNRALSSKVIAPQPKTSNNKEKINWVTIEELESLSKSSPKKVIVDVYTDWCKWCKVMDKQTFENQEVIDKLSRDYHMVKLNAEQKSAINYKGKSYNYVKNGRRGYNQVAVELTQGQLSYPSLVVLDENLNQIQILKGFQTPEKLFNALKSIESI